MEDVNLAFYSSLHLNGFEVMQRDEDLDSSSMLVLESGTATKATFLSGDARDNSVSRQQLSAVIVSVSQSNVDTSGAAATRSQV